MEILNNLRNAIAHNLVVNYQLVKEFLATLKTISNGKGNFNNPNSNDLDRMIGGIAFISGIIFGEYLRNKN